MSLKRIFTATIHKKSKIVFLNFIICKSSPTDILTMQYISKVSPQKTHHQVPRTNAARQMSPQQQQIQYHKYHPTPLMNSTQMTQMRPAHQPPIMTIDPNQKTTVFVGSIDTQAPDEMVIRMLRSCGQVADWKRASGANGTMQPFGLVKFEDLESTLRAIRVMDGLQVGSKNLLVKLSDGDKKRLDK